MTSDEPQVAVGAASVPKLHASTAMPAKATLRQRGLAIGNDEKFVWPDPGSGESAKTQQHLCGGEAWVPVTTDPRPLVARRAQDSCGQELLRIGAQAMAARCA